MNGPVVAPPVFRAAAATSLLLAFLVLLAEAQAQQAAQIIQLGDDNIVLGPEAEQIEELQKLQADHLVDQYRPMLEAELAFVQRICQTSPQQQEQITADATKALRTNVDAQFLLNRQLERRLILEQVAVMGPAHRLAQAISDSAQRHLSPEQFAVYDREARTRQEFRKRAIIDSVISELDAAVLLSLAQRERMREALSTNWQQDSYPAGISLIMQHRQRSFGNLDLSLVTHLLTPEQNRVWESLTGLHVQVWGRPAGAVIIDGLEAGGAWRFGEGQGILEIQVQPHGPGAEPGLDAEPFPAPPALAPAPEPPVPEPPVPEPPVPEPPVNPLPE
jgi:hypothetical protein